MELPVFYGAGSASGLLPNHGSSHVGRDVLDDMARLRWLTGRVSSAHVIGFAVVADAARLLSEVGLQKAW